MKTRYQLLLVAAATLMTSATLATATAASGTPQPSSQSAPPSSPQQAPPPRRGPPQKDMVLDQAKRADVLERLIAGLNGYYVFPEQAKAMEVELRTRDKRGEVRAIEKVRLQSDAAGAAHGPITLLFQPHS